jgi:hypothetical protein
MIARSIMPSINFFKRNLALALNMLRRSSSVAGVTLLQQWQSS